MNNRLTKLYDTGKRDSNRCIIWMCQCNCGNVTEVSSKNFGRSTNSCERCLNPNSNSYNNYGGRGIKICDRWIDGENGFQNFLEDMGKRQSIKYSIDRIDNNGNYEPGNCRWATMKEQANNRKRR